MGPVTAVNLVTSRDLVLRVVTAPVFNILTQKELTIDLSRQAMATIIHAIETREPLPLIDSVQCELDNFINTLLNLLERSEPGNFDLIGE